MSRINAGVEEWARLQQAIEDFDPASETPEALAARVEQAGDSFQGWAAWLREHRLEIAVWIGLLLEATGLLVSIMAVRAAGAAPRTDDLPSIVREVVEQLRATGDVADWNGDGQVKQPPPE